MIHSKVMTQLMSNNGSKCLYCDLPKLSKHKKILPRFLSKRICFVSEIIFSKRKFITIMLIIYMINQTSNISPYTFQPIKKLVWLNILMKIDPLSNRSNTLAPIDYSWWSMGKQVYGSNLIFLSEVYFLIHKKWGANNY